MMLRHHIAAVVVVIYGIESDAESRDSGIYLLSILNSRSVKRFFNSMYEYHSLMALIQTIGCYYYYHHTIFGIANALYSTNKYLNNHLKWMPINLSMIVSRPLPNKMVSYKRYFLLLFVCYF